MAMDLSSPKPAYPSNGQAAWPAYQMPPMSLDLIQRSVGNGVRSTSRAKIDQFHLAGLHEDQSVPLIGQRKQRETGIPWVDRLLGKAGAIADYTPQALQDASVISCLAGLVGGSLTAGITVLCLGLLKTSGTWVKSSVGHKSMLIAGCGITVGALSAVGGFCYSLIQNLRDVQLHFAKNSESKPKKLT